MAEKSRNWSRDAEELTAYFTVHARDLFGYACVLTDADRQEAGDLVQAAFEAAATVWCTLRDLPAGDCHDWLQDTMAAVAQRQTGHPAGAFVSPSHRRLTDLKRARFSAGYGAAAGLDRFAAWLRSHADESPASGPAAAGEPVAAGPPASGERSDDLPSLRPVTPLLAGADGPPGAEEAGPRPAGAGRQPGARLAGRPRIRPARLRAVGPDGTQATSGPGRPRETRAAIPPGSYGDPVSALYEQHYALLVRLAALLVRDTATAETIVQDSFVAVAAAWRRRGDTDGALDFLRHSVLERSRSALRHRAAPAGANGRPASPPLLAALRALPARQREVLVLRYYANLSEEEAADAIGISRAAVRRHATRANAALRADAALRTLLDAG